jgi:type IV pilus assembly protein PilN
VRLSINLASEPFRRDRHVMAGLGTLSALLVCTLAILTYLAFSARDRASVMRGEVERLNAQARALTNEQAQYDGTLRQPANAEVLERSVLLNTLLERKAISWTVLFSDLEKVLPENVRLISIRMPRASGPSQVTLDMTVGSKSPEPVLSLLRRLAASPDFGPASVSTSMAPTENEPLYRYRVSVNYAQKL